MAHRPRPRERPQDRIGLLLTIIAIAAAAVAVLTMPVASLARIAGLLDWRAMLRAFVIDLYAAAAAIVLGLAAFVVNRLRPWHSFRLGGAAMAFVAGVAVMVPIASTVWRTLRAPPIHDITTDTANPPQFVALLAERAAAHALNSTDYAPTTAVLQQAFYRDIKPKVLPLPMNEAFDRVIAEINAQGWRIAAADREQGRVEAVVTTFWIGFNDDVVFRLTAQGANETKVDMRSESRVGGGDIGTNAARVRRFLAALGP